MSRDEKYRSPFAGLTSEMVRRSPKLKLYLDRLAEKQARKYSYVSVQFASTPTPTENNLVFREAKNFGATFDGHQRTIGRQEGVEYFFLIPPNITKAFVKVARRWPRVLGCN